MASSDLATQPAAVRPDDHFSLFGLPARAGLDADALERAWREGKPRRANGPLAWHGQRSPAERRVAMQWAARASKAYRQLRDPLLRARATCASRPASTCRPRATPRWTPAFLMQQMEWREAAATRRAAPRRRARLPPACRVELRDDRRVIDMQRLLGRRTGSGARSQRLRRRPASRCGEWMFLERLGAGTGRSAAAS